MGKEPAVYDNAVIRKIDEGMGWVDENGSSPSKTADELGYDCKFLAGSLFSGPAWRERATGVWSACILNYRGITTTLLAKSFVALEHQYRVLHKRCDGNSSWHNRDRWQKFYSDRWEKAYRKWCCKAGSGLKCDCQLCRIAEGVLKKEAKKKKAKKKATKKRKKRSNG